MFSRNAAFCVVTVSVAPYAPYWILDTDYQTYSLVYSCENIVVGKLEFAWILSRTRDSAKGPERPSIQRYE
ncbi:hypothetical protein KUTeg_019822 [Tegillarca granosa]|uniref:Apolipoprotein D n=1 Tax=Tegillarca granosa TaxID=220873 RepID=A0ABQ9EDK5_TEGGR|nr:hypothetical protein KUTeg_019822 [Tegillarca granosa]